MLNIALPALINFPISGSISFNSSAKALPINCVAFNVVFISLPTSKNFANFAGSIFSNNGPPQVCTATPINPIISACNSSFQNSLK